MVTVENEVAWTEPALGQETRAHLLVVDDEEVIVLGLQETLKRAGYEVRTATSGVAALELLHQEQFALILTDQKMPQLTGLQFLARAKEIQPNASRVLMTGVLDLATVIDAINKGEIYRFIVKPWLREELIVTVANAVQRHQLICRNAFLQRTT